jgi:hypothetical protein
MENMVDLKDVGCVESVLKVSDFLSAKNYSENRKLVMPVYQRPYRWKEVNIVDLLTDLYYQSKRLGHRLGDLFNPDNAYRLGTVVLHQQDKIEQNKRNSVELALVDGQQRTLTLLLIMLAAIKSERFEKQLAGFTLVEIQLPDCSETQKNLRNNLDLIERHVNSPEFTPEVLDFLLNHCEVVQVTLRNLSEAFQFFDSQNARGLDLSPHDLLKAFHLREFPEVDSDLKQTVIEYWEGQDTNSLKLLFSDCLYPIRRWSMGKNAVYFSKSKVGIFKGVNLNHDFYPFQKGLRIMHSTVDNYNQHLHRTFDQSDMTYPFQMTQTLINGRRFFEWVAYYQKLMKPIQDSAVKEGDANWLKAALQNQIKPYDSSLGESARPSALTIMLVLGGDSERYQYTHGYRRGDQYVRRMFNALVLCYYDRFGEQDLSRAIEYIFIWAYSLRLKNVSVFLESVEKHIRENNLFMRLQQSLSPVDFLNKPLAPLTEISASNVEGIKSIFEELGYYSSEKIKESADA